MLKLFLLIALTLSLQAKHLHKESYYVERFCGEMLGKGEFLLDCGARVDCVTDTFAWEVERDGHKIYEAVGQSLYYSIMTGLKPAILVITKDVNSSSLKRLNVIAEKYQIKVKIIEEEL